MRFDKFVTWNKLLNAHAPVSSPVKWGSYCSSVQFSSVAQSCPTLCNPMKRSTPGLPVHHQLPEFTQTHVHRVGDAIQPSHPVSSPLLLLLPIPPSIWSFPMSQLFSWSGQSTGVSALASFPPKKSQGWCIVYFKKQTFEYQTKESVYYWALENKGHIIFWDFTIWIVLGRHVRPGTATLPLSLSSINGSTI